MTILYVLLGVVGILTLPPAELAASDAPLALLYEKSTGSFPYFITIIGLLAVLNGLLVQIIMASRILYGLSSAGWLPAILKSVNPKTRTPIFSTVLITLIILTLAIAFPIVRLAQATSAIIMVVFALVNASAFWVQWRDDRRRNLLSYRLFLPIIGVVATVGLIVLQLYSIL